MFTTSITLSYSQSTKYWSIQYNSIMNKGIIIKNPDILTSLLPNHFVL
nr:MAG TPA: hypothetical protein [Caudoviricetes sp.]